ncbi:MAG: hypothetical protein AAFV74_11515 [Pseudomonadota bacterium]
MQEAPQDDLSLLFETVRSSALYILLAGLLFGAGGYLTGKQLPKTYEAEAVVVLGARSSTAFQEQEVYALPEDGTTRAWTMRAEVSVATSQKIAEKALATLSEEQLVNLLPSEWETTTSGRLSDLFDEIEAPYNEADEETRRALIRGYKDNIFIGNDPNTFVLRVRAIAAENTLAAHLANAHATAYVQHNLERKHTEIDRILRAIEKELGSIDTSASQTKQLIQDLNKSIPQLIQSGPSIAQAQLTTLIEQVEETRDQLSLAKLDLKLAQNTNPLDLGEDVQRLNEVRTKLYEVETQKREFQGATSTEVRSALERRELSLRTILEEGAQEIIATKKIRVASLGQKLETLNVRARELSSLVNEHLVVQAQIDDLLETSRVYSLRRAELENRRAVIEATAEVIAADAEIIEAATPPLFPRSPNSKLLGLTLAVFGASLVVGVSLWRRRRKGGVQFDMGQQPNGFREALIGIVPSAQSDTRSTLNMQLQEEYDRSIEAVRDRLIHLVGSADNGCLLVKLHANSSDCVVFLKSLKKSFKDSKSKLKIEIEEPPDTIGKRVAALKVSRALSQAAQDYPGKRGAKVRNSTMPTSGTRDDNGKYPNSVIQTDLKKVTYSISVVDTRLATSNDWRIAFNNVSFRSKTLGLVLVNATTMSSAPKWSSYRGAG